jgi:lipoyl-dependent peroxiredoxin
MPVRKSEATWKGNLREGSGSMTIGKGVWEGSYSFPSRFEEGDGTNPEELIGAAHAGCFSMAFANGLAGAGYAPESVHTVASVHLERQDGGFTITTIELRTEARVPDIDEETFQEKAQEAKANCPVSRALTGVEIKVDASLV